MPRIGPRPRRFSRTIRFCPTRPAAPVMTILGTRFWILLGFQAPLRAKHPAAPIFAGRVGGDEPSALKPPAIRQGDGFVWRGRPCSPDPEPWPGCAPASPPAVTRHRCHRRAMLGRDSHAPERAGALRRSDCPDRTGPAIQPDARPVPAPRSWIAHGVRNALAKALCGITNAGKEAAHDIAPGCGPPRRWCNSAAAIYPRALNKPRALSLGFVADPSAQAHVLL